MEFKWACTVQHKRVLDDAISVHLPEGDLPISPIEAQVAYKLYLGSDKDVGDARYLFELFKESLDMKRLGAECAGVGVSPAKMKRGLGL